jgi:hypothetical protein
MFLLLFTVAMLVPVAVGLAMADPHYRLCLAGAIPSAAIGAALFLPLRRHRTDSPFASHSFS